MNIKNGYERWKERFTERPRHGKRPCRSKGKGEMKYHMGRLRKWAPKLKPIETKGVVMKRKMSVKGLAEWGLGVDQWEERWLRNIRVQSGEEKRGS